MQSEPTIPVGMVPYGPDHRDYPNAPSDWDGGVHGGVCLADGEEWGGWHGKGWATWDLEATNNRRIIAYTPRPDTPHPEPTPEVAATRDDREAAAAYCDGQPFACDMRVGQLDDHPLVQAFARHRLATPPADSTPAPTGEREGVEAVRRHLRAAEMDEAFVALDALAVLLARPAATGEERLREAAQAVADSALRANPDAWVVEGPPMEALLAALQPREVRGGE